MIGNGLFSLRLLKVRPGSASDKGRGVFAATDIATGEMVDAAVCVELIPSECDRIAGTCLDDYYFHHPDDDERGLLVLGLASLCNHSDDPNTETRYKHDAALGWIVVLKATRPIMRGEEVTRRYACSPWFQNVC